MLLQHPARRLAHFLGGNILAIHFGDNALARRTRQVAAQIARDKRDHHGRANQQQQAAEHNFLERSFSLQKSNHLLVTPEVCSRINNYKLRNRAQRLRPSPVSIELARSLPKNHLLKRINRRVIHLVPGPRSMERHLYARPAMARKGAT